AVGIRLQEKDDYPYFETNGFSKNFIKETTHVFNKDKKPDCICGFILKGSINSKKPFFTEGGSFWTNNLSELYSDKKNNINKIFTESKCIDNKYKSIALIPIKSDHEIIGLLQINDTRENIFSPDLINVLEGIGVGIGISFSRDKAIEELKINERRYALAQKAAEIGSWDWNILTGELIWSEKIEPMFGFKKNQFKGTYEAFLESIHPDDRQMVVESVNESLEKKEKKYSIEHRIIYPNKQIRWVLEKGDVIRDKKGNPVRMLGVVQDITRKKEMEEELKERHKFLEKIVDERTKEITKTNRKLLDEINERKKAEKYILQTKQHLRNIIDSASELIISFDMNNRVSTWNKTVEKLTGYKTIEVLNRSVNKLDVFDDSDEILQLIKNTCDKQKSLTSNIVLRTKENEKKIINIFATDIKGGSNECLGALFTGRDITYDLELHGKLIEGSSYLFPDEKIKGSIDLLVNLTIAGHNGLFITRNSPSVVNSIIPKSKRIKIALLSQQRYDEFETISNLDFLNNKIEKFCSEKKDTIILLDGIHYLTTRFSFDEFIESLYHINDIVAKKNAILILRVDPSIMDSKQIAVIRNELQLLPSKKIDDLIIDDEVYDLLKYIFEQNQLNSMVSIKKLTGEFKIAYVTAINRLKVLEENNLIFSKKEGKHKTLYITDKGKNLLQKRQIA
ncbi:MAG: PAS domain S-box protein, partial [Promethearchaeota archaeon]